MTPRPSPLFTTTLPQVRDGTKTMTRLPVPQRVRGSGMTHNFKDVHPGDIYYDSICLEWRSVLRRARMGRWDTRSLRFPYGSPGTVWYIREPLVKDAENRTAYQLDGSAVLYQTCHVLWTWKPSRLTSMYMPRWAARQYVEVVAVRIEPLQDITEADAKAEGFASIAEFRRTWDALYPAGRRWADNPWAFVYEWKPYLFLWKP